MPKENIADHSPNQYRVEVSWGRDRGVSIATINPHREDCVGGSVCGLPDHCPPSVTLDQRAATTTSSAISPDPLSNGWFVDLDRNGINRLIKSLRTARDQAFGRDE